MQPPPQESPPTATVHYGSVDEPTSKFDPDHPLGRGIVRKPNVLKGNKSFSIGLAAFNCGVPPLIFAILLWSMTAEIRYSNPAMIINCILAVSIVALAGMWFCIFIMKKMKSAGVLLSVRK